MSEHSRSSMLENLPSFNSSNFSNFQPECTDKRNEKRLPLYISTRDSAPEQVIKKDRSNIMFRYLYIQFDKRNNQSVETSKRKVAATNPTSVPNGPSSKVMKKGESSSVAK